ncbi:MAG: YciK family oxidoreductase [Pseudomonadota bacterium]
MTTNDTIIASQYLPSAGCLNDRVVLVTGASDGIGKAVAISAASHGARVVLLGRSSKKLEATYDTIVSADHPKPGIAVFDFESADGEAFGQLAETVSDTYGQLDGIAHIAGQLGTLTPFEFADMTEFQRVMHVNFTAPVVLTKVLLPLLKASNDASLVFASSSVGRIGRAHWGAYAVSKFATEGFAQVLADENRNTNIRVHVINPGKTRTDMRLAAYPGEDRDTLPTPEQIAPIFVYHLGAGVGKEGPLSIDAQSYTP